MTIPLLFRGDRQPLLYSVAYGVSFAILLGQTLLRTRYFFSQRVPLRADNRL